MKRVIIFIGIMLLLSGCTIQKINDDETVSSIKFSEEYKTANITMDNSFKYVTDIEVINFFENGTGIIYFGTPDSYWSEIIVKVLNEISSKYEDLTIYYFDISTSNDSEYEVINNHLIEELGTKDLIIPNVFFIKDGVIIDNIYDIINILIDTDMNLNDEQYNDLKTSIGEKWLNYYTSLNS